MHQRDNFLDIETLILIVNQMIFYENFWGLTVHFFGKHHREFGLIIWVEGCTTEFPWSAGLYNILQGHNTIKRGLIDRGRTNDTA